MTTKINYCDKVADALTVLSDTEGSAGPFRIWFTAKRVAMEAGVSESTARRHLEDLSTYRGFERRKIRGSIGYHFSMIGHR